MIRRPIVPVLMLAFAMPLAVASTAVAQTAPVVENVVALQVPGTGTVSVTYDVSDADGDSVTVSVIFSSSNGTAFDLLPRTITGDVNRRIATGTGKSITWNAAADYPGYYWPQVVAKVIANDGRIAASEMVLVPAGAFTRGSDVDGGGDFYAAQYGSITLNSFYIDKYEVTNAEFKQFIDAGGYSTRAYWSTDGWALRVGSSWTLPVGWSTTPYVGPTYPGFPVSGISWYEAEAYANFVGKRLPTEAEWEKAARGTDGRTYPWGATLDVRRANWLNSSDPNDNGPTPAGYFNGTLYQALFQSLDSPSFYGAYDMAGNVAEWVRDWYSSNYYYNGPVVVTTNPPGPSSGTERVRRGGSFSESESSIRTFHRLRATPTTRASNTGFRLAKPATP